MTARREFTDLLDALLADLSEHERAELLRDFKEEVGNRLARPPERDWDSIRKDEQLTK